MDRTELRIGNKVLIDGDTVGEILTIKESSSRVEYFPYPNKEANVHATVEHSRLTGLPLTEEILLKAGVTKWGEFKEDSRWFVQDTPIGMVIFKFDGLFLYNEGATNQKEGNPMRYLHQLQNRFFSWTGTEININL